jgi:hypothetical protein
VRRPSNPEADITDVHGEPAGPHGRMPSRQLEAPAAPLAEALPTMPLPEAPGLPPGLETQPLPEGRPAFAGPILPFVAQPQPPIPPPAAELPARLGDPPGRDALASWLAVGLTAILFGLVAAILVWWGMAP